MYKNPHTTWPNQLLVDVWAYFEQTGVDKRHTRVGNDSGPVSRPRYNTLTHTVICDAVHCLKRHTVLNDS